MLDTFGRTIDYLRVSVTDRCNFRCVYCMPEEGAEVSPKAELLNADEFVRIVRIAVELGIRKVRITGGEPLVRKDLPALVAALAKLPIEDLSLTTNGFLLPEQAQTLAAAGLHRVNISLDTLRSDRFRALARRGDLQTVLNGIAAAQAAGLAPIKINCVAMRGDNDDEAVDFAKWTTREPVHVRFIEVMPIRWNLDDTAPQNRPLSPLPVQGMLSDLEMRRRQISAAKLRDQIESALGPMEPAELPTNGPARTFRLAGAPGTVGFISQISDDLCQRCNRIRLTADGYLRPCLMEDGEIGLRELLRSSPDDSHIADAILRAVHGKPERHYLAEGQRVTGRGMSQIGG